MQQKLITLKSIKDLKQPIKRQRLQGSHLVKLHRQTTTAGNAYDPSKYADLADLASRQATNPCSDEMKLINVCTAG